MKFIHFYNSFNVKCNFFCKKFLLYKFSYYMNSSYCTKFF